MEASILVAAIGTVGDPVTDRVLRDAPSISTQVGTPFRAALVGSTANFIRVVDAVGDTVAAVWCAVAANPRGTHDLPLAARHAALFILSILTVEDIVTALVEGVVAGGGRRAAQRSVGTAKSAVQLITEVRAISLAVAAPRSAVTACASRTTQPPLRAITVKLIRVVLTLHVAIAGPMQQNTLSIEALKLIWPA